MSVLKFTKYILFYKVSLFLIKRIIINGCTSLISTMLSPKVQFLFLIKKSWGSGEECPFRTGFSVLFSSKASELNDEIGLFSAFFERFYSYFTRIFTRVSSLLRPFVKAENRKFMTKAGTLADVGFWMIGYVCLSAYQSAVAAFRSSGWALMRSMKLRTAVAAPLPLATALCFSPDGR